MILEIRFYPFENCYRIVKKTLFKEKYLIVRSFSFYSDLNYWLEETKIFNYSHAEQLYHIILNDNFKILKTNEKK